MDRLKKIWTSYKEVLPSTSQHYSSDSDQINDKVIIARKKFKTNFVFFLFLLHFRSEMITLQSNVDYLSNRITSRDNNFKNENNYNEDYSQIEGT